MKDLIASLRLGYLIVIKYFTRYIRLILGILIFTLIPVFLQWNFQLIDFNSNYISQGLIGTYQEHDLPLEVQRLLSKGLVKVDSNGRIVPELVSGWEVNNDATIFKFKLKDDLAWIDGSMVTSSNFDFGIPNVEVSLPDDKTIQFKLKEPYSPFPSLLIKPVFKKGTLIGVGPYKVIKLEKSRIFITKLVLASEDTNLPGVIIRFYPNEKIGWTGFSLGEVQSLVGLASTASISEFPLAKLKQEIDYSKIVTIMYDTTDPLLANRSLRQALSYSAPEIHNEVIAQGPIYPFSWAYSPDNKQYLSNPEEAKAALTRAKAASSEESLKKEIVLTTTPQLEEAAKKIISAWRDLGLNAVLRIESGIPQKFQALLITQSMPVDPDQYFLWHKTQTKTNITKYDKARVDKDLEDGRKFIREEDRKEKYLDFQKALLEDSPATFLYFPKYNVVYLNKVEEKLNKVFPLQFNNLAKK